MKLIKKCLINVLIIFLLYILTDFLMSYLQVRNGSSFNISKWIDLCLKSIHIHTEDGRKFFEFPKLLATISIYLIVELEIILNIANYSLGFKEIIKYHSKNKLDYLKNIIKVISKINWLYNLKWLLVFIVPVVIDGKYSFSLFDLTYILIFLVINFIFNNFIALISDNPLTVILFFTSKHLLYSMFRGYEMIFLGLLILIIFIFYHIKKGDIL